VPGQKCPGKYARAFFFFFWRIGRGRRRRRDVDPEKKCLDRLLENPVDLDQRMISKK
jgi:hypothetical protein